MTKTQRLISILSGKSIACSKKSLRTFSLLLVFAFLIAGPVAAQERISDAAARQIKSLMDEKASRTSAQKKINSQILYALKMDRGQRITPEVASLRTNVVKDAQGRIKVDLKAVVTPRLLNQLRVLGCEIIFSSERFSAIVANIPLDKVEQIAALIDVQDVDLWSAPMNNHGFSDPGKGERINNHNPARIPDFGIRAENIRKKVGNAIDRMKKTTAAPFFAGSIVSEADVTHKADLARSVFGVNGAGIKIGVLSDGVDGYATSQASGDLPPVITILPGQAGGGSEGRAMLELIHDLAPGADLYFATAFISQASFAQNILALRAAGCDIIVDDITYFREGVFQDDNVSQAVNAVTASGALFFSSAGNSGNKNDNTSGVWEGDFVDGGASVAPLPLTGNLHNFSGGTLFNTLTTGGRVTLKWSDPLGQSGNDYDLFVTNSAGTAVVAVGLNVQDGNDLPYEDVGTCFTGERLYILKKTGAGVRALHLNTNRGRLTFNTPGVIYGHNAAAAAFSVAATPAAVGTGGGPTGPYPGVFSSVNTVELFTSDGPRRMFFNPDGTEITPGNILFATNGGIILQKPNFTAADGTLTTTPGFTRFYGTSAAAPHAAAIAALIKSGIPGITNAQINNALVSTAIDIESPGHDRDAGAGIIMAYEAMVAAGATTTYAMLHLGAVTTAEGSFSNGNSALEPGEVASMTVTLTNLSPNIGATNVNAVLTSSTPGVTILSAVDYGNIAASATVNNAAKPFIIGISSSVLCNTNISFTLTITYEGGETAQQAFTLPVVKTGRSVGTITGALGSAPTSGIGFTAGSGLQTNRLNRNGIASTCAAPKVTPSLQEPVGTQKAYHSYRFANTATFSQCVTVSFTSSSVTSQYVVVYGNGGYNPTSIQLNYLADQGSSGTAFSFIAPAGQQFTVVVHEVNTNGAIGISYNLNVGLNLTCAPVPSCRPVEISPLALPAGNSGSPYNQLISATGGSGHYIFSYTGTLPAGLSFSNNSFTGTPTEVGSFPITVMATDITGCPAGTANYTLLVQPALDAPTATLLQSGNNPSCAGTNVTFTATVTSGGNAVTTGTVTFTEGATVLAGNVALNGSGIATFNTSLLSAGSHTILATYNAPTGYLTSSGSVDQEVNPATNISLDPVDKTIYALNNTTFSVTASGTAPVTYKWHESTDGGTSFNPLSDGGIYSGTSSSTLSLTAVPFTMNGNKYRCVVTGGCGNATSAAATLVVNKRPTIITYTGDNNEQYSDQQTLTAILKDELTDAVLTSKTVTFTIGTQSVSDGPGAPGNGTDANGIAAGALTLHQNIGPYTVVSSFAGDEIYQSSSDSDPFRILKENAIADYTGPEFVSVPCATCATVKVLLSASVRDTTAVYPLNDTRPGDIRKARVRFLDLNTNSPISGWLTPGLVNAMDSTRGIVNYEWTVTIPNTGYNVYSIAVIVDSIPNTLTGNYIGRTETVVSISRSSLKEFITGGGNVVPTNSEGQYASDPGLKMHFGHNLKYNKSNTKLQGNMNLIFRRGGRVYQIKSTSISSLSINSTDPCSRNATFTSKANLQDVTDPNALPQPVLGNLTLNVTMTDNGTPGVNNDKIGVTLWNGNNLVYSSNWVTTQTIELPLNGGNLEVHNGVVCPDNTKTASPPITAVKEGRPGISALTVQAYPNPLSSYATISYVLPAETRVSLAVYDNLGRKLAQLVDGRVSAGRHLVRFDASKLAAGIYTYSLQAEDAEGKPVIITGKLIVSK